MIEHWSNTNFGSFFSNIFQVTALYNSFLVLQPQSVTRSYLPFIYLIHKVPNANFNQNFFESWQIHYN